MEKKSQNSELSEGRELRVRDPIGGPPNLALYFRNYEQSFQQLKHYSHHLRKLTAQYSRGDGPDELRQTFSLISEKVKEQQQSAAETVSERVFAHKKKYAEAFRDALVVVSVGLCLRAPKSQIMTVLNSCERGDPLLETLAAVAAPGSAQAHKEPAFYQYFDRLYDALTAQPPERERCVREYLATWYREKMEGFAFKDLHREEDTSEYVGYWCFEAAGTVAALGVDDRTFADHPHYPKDLVAFYQERGGR